jgi:hypothetical protein
VAENAKRFDSSRGFEPWLFSIARNLTMDYFRRVRPESLDEPLPSGDSRAEAIPAMQMSAVEILMREQRANLRTLAWLLLFAWTTTLATWPILRLISQDAQSLLNISFVHTYHVLIGFTVLSWLAAGCSVRGTGKRGDWHERFQREISARSWNRNEY